MNFLTFGYENRQNLMHLAVIIW